ncbi:MAG TPA: C40 family peptidase [Gemmatimonadales bacterium]|nr:C40 family peptidase [Gemmatimonadales bacterium]
MVGANVGHLFAGEGWTEYRIGYERELLGPIGGELHGIHLRETTLGGERLWGGGVDVSLFRTGRQGVYTVGGVAGGLAQNASRTFWGAWSAGAGFQVLPFGPVELAAEARWRHLTPGARDGVELSVRLGIATSRGTARTPIPPGPSAAEPAGAAPVPAEPAIPAIAAPASLGDSVVATAARMMGSAYRLGGTGAGGFDCSGLIQYAYGQHGIALPRTSREQARQGREVPRDLADLAPGDILTFSNAGGPVTHVGLYVGDRRFIHSATGGVQLSLLSDADPYGRWWWRRWVGARRVVGQNGASR